MKNLLEAGKRADALRQATLNMEAEGQGLLQIYMVKLTVADTMKYLVAGIDGDDNALKIMQLADKFLQAIATEKPPCLLCDNNLAASQTSYPAAVTVIRARRDNPREAIVSGICPNCFSGKTDAELNAAMMKSLRETGLFSELRELPISGQVGQA